MAKKAKAEMEKLRVLVEDGTIALGGVAGIIRINGERKNSSGLCWSRVSLMGQGGLETKANSRATVSAVSN